MLQVGYLYSSLITKKKERFDIILEPLQAFIQLALLSFTPIDSKLNIYNNILYIQIPGWKQSIVRTYYSDSKSDLFFLFNVIKRFNKFYKHLKNISNNNNNLFNLLKSLSNKGIDNLLQTYKHTDNPALLHTLNLYKDILNKSIHQNIKLSNNDDNNQEIQIQEPSSPESPKSQTSSIPPTIGSYMGPSFSQSTNIDIDNVFINITNLYSEYELTIIFNTLLLIEKNPNNYLDYMEGLNKILDPINIKIKKWIVDNIVY